MARKKAAAKVTCPYTIIVVDNKDKTTTKRRVDPVTAEFIDEAKSNGINPAEAVRGISEVGTKAMLHGVFHQATAVVLGRSSSSF